MQFEFLIPKRPVSLQTRQRSKLQNWQAFVRAEASKTWVGTPYSGNVHLALVYLYDADPVDTDNIIKPIQDGLIGLVYEDDSLSQMWSRIVARLVTRLTLLYVRHCCSVA